MSDTWQIIEVARRMGFKDMFPWDESNHIEMIYKEYSQFHEGNKHGTAPFEVLKENPGMRWPYVNGKETRWRFNGKYDPACKDKGFDFYGKPDHKACIIARPFEEMPEPTDSEYPFLLNTGRVVEHWHTGSMTRRVPALHQAMPEAYVELNPNDAKRLSITNGDKVKVSSRRGTIVLKAQINGRGRPVEGQIFVPFFDEKLLINELTLDAFCPISKQPDYKKCAVKVEKHV